MITLIAAVSKNGFIGVNGELPWKLPDDMAHFKNITTGNVVVMGRKTFESIGEPLPDRANIVISRTMDFTTPGMYGQTSLEAALEFGKNIGEVFVIGGGEIYESAISLADKLIITHVDEEVDGDVKFPAILPAEWVATGTPEQFVDAASEIAFSIVTYERVPAAEVDPADPAVPPADAPAA